MSDLPQRLRRAAECLHLPPSIQEQRNIRAMNVCGEAAAEIERLRAALAALTEPHADGFNGCYRQAVAALKYLAEHPRPDGGQSEFNSEHLHQIAREIELSRPQSK